jgi:DNA-binding helix-hairpin-helix protein with protein kinase domain
MYHFLRAQTVRQATLSGIGPRLKDQLAAKGVVTAADVDARIYSVKGIGEAKAQALKGWRYGVEWRANQAAPSALPDHEITRISSKYASRIQAIEMRISLSGDQQSKQRDAITEKYMIQQHRLAQQEEAARRSAEKRVEEIRLSFKVEKEQLAQRFRTEKAKADAVIKGLDAKLVELGQALFKKRAEFYQLQREHQRYQNVTFGGYVRRILSLPRAA